MFLEFTPIENLLEPHDGLIDEKTGIRKHPGRWRPFSFWEQFFYCQCGHIFYSHNIDTEECDAEYFGKCDCKKIVFVEASLEITFTLADLFEVENPNHSDQNSAQYMIEFGEWYENYKKVA